MRLKVAAYCRVSTDKEDQVNSLESQREYFRSYILSKNEWELVEVYYDEGISGTSTRKRTGFNRMIKEACGGFIDLILTKDVTRFARNTVDTLSYTRQLKNKGVGVFFINDNIDTRDTDGELRLTIMASIAQEESRKTSERVKWGQTRRMEQGVVFGRSMLGYEVKNGKLILNPQEAEIVKMIYHKFLNENKGTHVIARELFQAGIKPKRVKEWSNTVILRVLKNEKYVGDLCQKKTYTPDYLTHGKKYNRGVEDKVYIKDHHEAIIDRDTWNKTQKELKRRRPSEEVRSKHSNRYWCSGKVVCGLCGKKYIARQKTMAYGKYKAWRCSSGAKHGREKIVHGEKVGCSNIHVNERSLKYCVGYLISNVQKNSSYYINEITKNIKALNSIPVDTDTSTMYTKIDSYNLKKNRLIDFVLDGVISKEEMVKQKEYYDQEIEDIRNIINNVEQKNIIRNKQIFELETQIKNIEELIQAPFEDETTSDIVEFIKVLPENQLIIKLKLFPFNVHLKYSTEGFGECYKTAIESEIFE